MSEALMKVMKHSYIQVTEHLYLRRRHNLECLRNLLLPRQAVLAKDFRTRLEVFDTFVQQSCPQDNAVGAEGLLLMVHVRGAVLAVELVNC